MIGVLAAFRINYWLYLILAYGWGNVRKLNLHITSHRPLIISNGDKVSELADFGIFAASLVLGFVIAAILLSSIESVTRRLGKAIDVIKTMDVLAKEDRGSVVFGIMGMLIACATTFVTIHASSLHVLRNCVIFVVITSIVLRIALGNVASTRFTVPKAETRTKKLTADSRSAPAYPIATGIGPWLIGFWRYFTSSYGIVIGTNYSLEETKHRLLELNQGRDVYVRINAKGQVFMNATAHAGGGKGTPMIPELCAQFQNDATCTILTGSIGAAPIMKLFIWSFLAMLLVGEFLPSAYEAFPGVLLIAIGCVLLVMILCYETGRSDQKVIVQRLTEATGIEPIIV